MKPQFAGQRDCFSAPVDGLASDDVLKRDALVPPVPLLVTAERATGACAATLEEIKNALRFDQAPRGRRGETSEVQEQTE